MIGGEGAAPPTKCIEEIETRFLTPGHTDLEPKTCQELDGGLRSFCLFTHLVCAISFALC